MRARARPSRILPSAFVITCSAGALLVYGMRLPSEGDAAPEILGPVLASAPEEDDELHSTATAGDETLAAVTAEPAVAPAIGASPVGSVPLPSVATEPLALRLADDRAGNALALLQATLSPRGALAPAPPVDGASHGVVAALAVAGVWLRPARLALSGSGWRGALAGEPVARPRDPAPRPAVLEPGPTAAAPAALATH